MYYKYRLDTIYYQKVKNATKWCLKQTILYTSTMIQPTQYKYYTKHGRYKNVFKYSKDLLMFRQFKLIYKL